MDHATTSEAPDRSSPRRTFPRPRSPLDTVVAAALRTTACDPGDVISQIAVAEAVEELIALEPTRPGTWRLRGLAEGYDLFAAPLPAPTPDLEGQRLAGVLEAAVERGDTERIEETTEAAPEALDGLVHDGDLPVAGDVLIALLDRDPELAVRLAGSAPEPFARWDAFVDAVLKHTASEPEALRSALLEVLERWAASATPAVTLMREAIERVRAAGL